MKKIFTLLSFVALGISVNAQTNLLTNPGFETWTDTATKPDGWNSANGGSFENTTKHSGNNSIKLVPVSATTNANVGATDVAAEANTLYTVSYWVLDNVANSRARHWIQFRTDTASIAVTNSPFQPSTYTTDNASWQNVTASATSPAGTTKIRFDFRVYAQNGIATDPIYFDDVILVKGTLGVDEINKLKNSIKLSSSVVDSSFELSLKGNASVKIISANGQVVDSKVIKDSQLFNTSSLVKGVYLVQIEQEGNVVVKKIIKK